MSPRKITFVGMRTPGEKRMTKIYDPTGITGVEMLAAGLHGMATNPSTKWFSLRIISQRIEGEDGEMMDINELPEVQAYLADVEETIWQRLYSPGTNFTTAIHEVYLDLSAFGNAVLFVGQQEDGELLFECRPLAEVYYDENADGKIDTVFRKSCYTVRQMVQLSENAGWAISDEVKQYYADGKVDEKIDVVHAVYPREDRIYHSKDQSNMPWASCYFETKTKQMLSEKGFAEFPYQVARWSKYGGEIYGRGPGMVALPDTKMLQVMTAAKIKLIHKTADPPMWISDEGRIGQTKTYPGAVNYWRGNPGDGIMLQPLNMQGLQYLIQDISMLKEQIMRTFYADLMRMVDRENMTATEVIQRTQEMMRLLGPLVGRLESELLGPLINRVYGILTRRGLLPEPPEIIDGTEFVVEYVSPIATAQKQSGASGIVQVMQMIGALGPDIAMAVASKNIDVDRLFRWLWDLFNNNPDLLKRPEVIQEQNEQEAAAQNMAAMAPMGNMVQQAGSGIRDIAQAGKTAQEGGMDVNDLMQAFMQQSGEPQESPDMAEQLSGASPPEAFLPNNEAA